jgi:putative protease
MSEEFAIPTKKTSKTELLAPAGGLTSFFAALEAGADAVFCGLENFSARAKAKNFSFADLTAMTTYAQQHAKKIYVALNTLITEAEIPQLIETLAQLEHSQIDGVIVQDLACWRLIKNHFPSLALHASTQMTVHNSAGVNMLAEMGFKRVVLARELTLAEISTISRETAIELEHFVHGALCFSISGQCLFSSFLTGKSGNRGRCSQPCRRSFNYQDKPGYYFSTSDLCAIEHLPQLIAAGITSFKIEGRMKSAEYVGRVVAAYRMVLDAPDQERPQSLAHARQHLDLSFGRRATSGFLTDKRPTTLTTPARQGTIGQYLGAVEAVRGKTVFVKLAEKLHIGDRLNALPKNDRTGAGLTVIMMQLDRKKVKAAAAGATVGIETAAANRIHQGDAIYKVAAAQAFPASEVACRQKLGAVKPARAPLALQLRITPESLVIRGEAAGVMVEKSYELATYPAKDRPLAKDILARTFLKSGEHPFVLAKLTAENLPAIVIPPSRLNEIRRNFFAVLATEIADARDGGHRQHRLEAMATIQPSKPCRPATQRHLTVTVATATDIGPLAPLAIDRFAIPLTPDNIRDLAQLSGQAHNCRQELIWDIPALVFPDDWPQVRQAVQHLLGQGFTTFRLNNIGHFALFAHSAETELLAGGQLYAMNSEAIRSWQELGVKEITLPIEADRRNIAALMARKNEIKICVTIHAPLALMTSRIPAKGIKTGGHLFSGEGAKFQLNNTPGLTVLHNAADFSLLAHLDELQAVGCSRFHLDLSHCGPLSPRGRMVLQAWTDQKSLPETTAFNFARGLE